VQKWLLWCEVLASRAAEQGAGMVVMTEDLTHVGLTLTYLDDPSVFRRIADHQAEVVPRRLGSLAARLGVHRDAHLAEVAGRSCPYHWDYWRDEEPGP
jgi:hypothetical protein